MTATTSTSPSVLQTSPPQSLTIQASDSGIVVANGNRKSVAAAGVQTAGESKPPALPALPAPPAQTNGKRSPRQTSPEATGSPSSPSRRSTNLAEEGDVVHASQLEQLRKSHAQRRPKMLRLTPAHSSAPPAVIKARERAKLSFPGGENGNTTMAIPLHPGSRKALALKASAPSDAPPGLQLDLACLPVPTRDDKHNPASTSTIPDLVRKKSGEPIKSSLKHYPTSAFPSRADSLESSLLSRAKSVPSTPTLPKAVHFGNDLEQVKLFKHKQRPSAVSRDGSPEQTETETEEEHDFPFFAGRKPADSSAGARSPMLQEPQEQNMPPAGEEQLLLRLPNFPSSTKLSIDRDIFLERVFLADDLRSVRGTIQVRNIAFEKWVAVRFTLDNWATVNEVSADYQESIKDGAADRFTFSIKLNELLNWPRGAGQHETKSMFVCLRFRTPAHEIWDNNEGKNYQLDFRKRPVPVQVLAAQKSPTDSNASAAPRSARTKQFLELGRKGVSNMSRPGHQMMEDLKRELSKLKSDEEETETAARSKSFAEELSKRRSPPASPTNRSSSPSQWTARYDFGESLKNPSSGSRSLGTGRTAGPDYFSHKFRSPAVASGQEAARTESGQGWLTPEEGSERGRTPPLSRVCAGREEGMRHDGFQAGSRTPSPNLSPASFTPTRFNTYPPRGNSPLSSLSPSYTPRTPSPVNNLSSHTEGKIESFGARLDSALASPTSPSGFSPSGSTASLDSTTTIGFETSEDLFGRGPSSRSSTESMESTASFRPASTTSLEDLVARFCWNSDTLSSGPLTPASATAFQQGSGPPTPRMPGP